MQLNVKFMAKRNWVVYAAYEPIGLLLDTTGPDKDLG